MWLHGSEHKRSVYNRYHQDIYMPDNVLRAAERFLPHPGEPLPLSVHYQQIKATRTLPKSIYMPYAYQIVDVTVFRPANTIFRVLIRAPWNAGIDIGLVLEGDFEVVTAFWMSPTNRHDTLDRALYEQKPGAREELLEGGT